MAGKVIVQGIHNEFLSGGTSKILVDSVQVGTVDKHGVMEIPVYKDCVITAKMGLFSAVKAKDGYHARPNTVAVLQLEYNQVSGKLSFQVVKEEVCAEEVKAGADTPEDLITEAKRFAQSVELQVLKAPASAKFCALEEMTASEVGGVYTVSGYVDSQNSYGAMIRTPFTLHVQKTDTVGWVCRDEFVSHEKQARSYLALWIVLGAIASIVGAVITYFQIQDLLG